MSKVALARCHDYSPETVHEAVKRSCDLLGGIGNFVKPGMKVLLKPNLLSPRPPEDAVDTHPEVVRAVVRLVKGAGGIPMIGDSPGGYGQNYEEVYALSGIKSVAESEGVELVRFSSPRFVDGIPVSRYVFESDCHISIPKLKTHCLTMITAAIKNTFGTVTGPFKPECHFRAPKENDFAKIIAKVYSISRPHLNIVDGVWAMEGDGPSSGEVRKLGLVMASTDAVAIDSCFARIIGIDPLDILVTKEAYALGLGEAEIPHIEVLGEALENFALKDFKMPQTLPVKYIPKSIVNFVAGLLRYKPVIDEKSCRRCNLCKLSCPAHAIRIEKDRCDIDYAKCIRCLCCHEVCPYKAIDIKRNLLTRLIWS